MGELIKLGSKAKDKVSGFTGIVTARTEYLYGTTQVLISPTTETSPDGRWFDEPRLEEVVE